MAKNYSLKDIQEKIDNWITSHGGYWPPLSMLGAIIEEIGEIAREVNHLEGFKPKKPNEQENDIGEELADLLFSIICISNHYNIDLSEKMDKVLTKYSNRDSNRFL